MLWTTRPVACVRRDTVALIRLAPCMLMASCVLQVVQGRDRESGSRPRQADAPVAVHRRPSWGSGWPLAFVPQLLDSTRIRGDVEREGTVMHEFNSASDVVGLVFIKSSGGGKISGGWEFNFSP